MRVIFFKYLIYTSLITFAFAAAVTKSNDTSSSSSSEEIATEQPKNGLYADECVKEIDVPEDDVKKLKSKDISNASDKLQCYLNCVFEKDEIIMDGILNDEVINDRLQNVTTLNDDELTKIVNICKVIEGEDKCDISYRLSKCFIEHKANPIVWRVATIIQ